VVRACLLKDWPGVQELREAKDFKEVKENAAELA
jgi:hypothetical protein